MRRASTTSHLTLARAAFAGTAILLGATSLVLAAPRRAAHRAPRRTPHRTGHRAPTSMPAGGVQVGGASWYGPGFDGRRTASGERFNRNAATLAHRSMPFGTRVRITNLKTGRSAVGRVNDRGPFVRGRIVDLTEGLARQLGISGIGQVKVEVLGPDNRPVSESQERVDVGAEK